MNDLKESLCATLACDNGCCDRKLDDNINHPDHYNHCGIETIDVIAAWTNDLDGEEAFDIGNAIKYISRWKRKNGIEDLKKAVWYLNRVIELNEE